MDGQYFHSEIVKKLVWSVKYNSFFWNFLCSFCLRLVLRFCFFKNIPKIIYLMHNFLKFFSLFIKNLSTKFLRLILSDKFSPRRSLSSIYFWIATIVHYQNFFNRNFLRLNESRRNFLHMSVSVPLQNFLFILFPSLLNKMPHIYWVNFLPRTFTLIASWWTPFWFKFFTRCLWLMGDMLFKRWETLFLSGHTWLTWVSFRFEALLFLFLNLLLRIRSRHVSFHIEVRLDLCNFLSNCKSWLLLLIDSFDFAFLWILLSLNSDWCCFCVLYFNVDSTLTISFRNSLR